MKSLLAHRKRFARTIQIILTCLGLILSATTRAAPPTDHWLSWFGLQPWQVVFDQDGDGLTAEEEFNWGTDPLNPASVPYAFGTVSNRWVLRVAATPNVLAYLQTSADLVSWEAMTNLPPATNGMLTLELSAAESQRFYRIGSLVHTNSDGDCLLDFEEVMLYGTDPLRADTDGDGLNDCDEVKLYRTDPNHASPTGRGAISGKVVLDEDKDPATRNHPGIAGWTVFVDLDYDGELDATEPRAVSQADGSYFIGELDPGFYRVAVVIPLAWQQIFPAPNPVPIPDGYPDRVVEVFDSGTGPIPFPYGRYVDPLPGLRLVFPSPPPIPVDASVVLGALPPPPIAGPYGGWAHVDILAIPTNSFVTVAFDGEEIVDGPGPDLAIWCAAAAASDQAELFLGTTSSNLTSIGVFPQSETIAIDLAMVGVPAPVRFVKVRGMGMIGTYPGIDLVGFEALHYRPQLRGHYEVTVVGGQTLAGLDFGVAGEDRPPKVLLSTGQTDVRAGQSVTAQVTATDDLGIATVQLTANGVAVPLDAQLTGTVSVTSGGLLTLAATATDTANQRADTLLTLIARNADGSLPDLSGLGVTGGASNGGPSIQVLSPVAGEILFTPRMVVGTIAGTAQGLSSWQVHYAPADLVNPQALDAADPDYVLLSQGTTPVINGNLGTLPADTLPAGAYLLRVSAADNQGSTRYLGFVIGVRIDPLDIRPEIVITKPTNETTVTFVTNVIGSITTRQQLREWYVEYAPLSQVNLQNLSANSASWQRIASGTNAMTNAALATLDTTLLPNDSYVVRVSAWNQNGLGWAEPVVVHVTGSAKLGNFAMEFTDVELPLAGIPITIKRVYDSLNAARSGDFGFGWSLAVQDADIAETVPQTGSGFGSTPFRMGTRVYLTAPDGKRIGFTFQPEIGAVSFIGTAYKAVFKPDPGITYTLSVPEGDTAFLSLTAAGEAALFFIPLPWNPDTYILTDRQGTSYTYDQTDGFIEIEDSSGNRVTFSHEAIEHSGGSQVQLKRDTADRITQITAPDGRIWTYHYDGAGDLVQVLYPGNVQATLGYATNRPHFLETINDPTHGPTQRTEYDMNGRVTAIIDAAGNRLEQTWNPGAFAGTYSDARGNVTQLTYDALGNLVRRQDPLGGVTTWEYKSTNNPTLQTAVTDPRGTKVTSEYDTRGNLLRVTGPLAVRITYTYDDHDRLLSMNYNWGGYDRFEYDAAGNIVRFESPIASYDLTYTASGLPASVLDGGGGLTRLEYDGALSKPSRLIAPDGATDHFQYDAAGRLTQHTDAGGATTRIEYDALGRIAKQTDANGGVISLTYDSALPNLPSRVTNRMNQVTYYTYDTLGRLTALETPGGAITQFEYDTDGNRTAIVDPATNRYEFAYDAMNHLIEETDPLGKKRLHGYDLAGNRTNTVDRLDRRRSFTYDALSRLSREQWHEPVGQGVLRTITYEYDRANRLSEASDPDATISPSWFGTTGGPLLFEEAVYAGLPVRRISSTFDKAGRRTRVDARTGTYTAIRLDYVRDLAGRLRILTSSNPLPPATITNNAWQLQLWLDERGEVAELRRFADPYGDNRVSQTFLTHNEACGCNVTSFSHVIATNQPLPDAAMTFTRNLDGVITSLLDGTNNLVFGYDAGARLTSVIRNGAASENYTYDPNGNRTASHVHAGYITGSANRVSQAGAWALAYDFEGNLVTKSNTVSGELFIYTWDHRNRLTLVTHTNTPAPDAGSVTEYRYDPLNRRIAVIKNSQTNWTYYDRIQPLAEYVNAETAPSAVFANGEKPDQLYAVWTRAEGMFWTLTDQIGSVRRVLDARGNEVAALHYDSYGNLVSATGTNPDAAGRFAFAGREWDTDTGLYFNRARYYDPDLGRFISEDPLGFDAGEANLYGYARSNPLRYRDPLGTVSALEYLPLLVNRLEAACDLATAVQTLYLQLFAALSLADSGALDPDTLTGIAEALAGLGGFSIQAPLGPLEDAAVDKLWEELGLGDLAGLLDAAKKAYDCGSGLGGGG